MIVWKKDFAINQYAYISESLNRVKWKSPTLNFNKSSLNSNYTEKSVYGFVVDQYGWMSEWLDICYQSTISNMKKISLMVQALTLGHRRTDITCTYILSCVSLKMPNNALQLKVARFISKFFDDGSQCLSVYIPKIEYFCYRFFFRLMVQWLRITLSKGPPPPDHDSSFPEK
jgi:hypothetical protein